MAHFRCLIRSEGFLGIIEGRDGAIGCFPGDRFRFDLCDSLGPICRSPMKEAHQETMRATARTDFIPQSPLEARRASVRWSLPLRCGAPPSQQECLSSGPE